MRISDWSSDVCSSDLLARQHHQESPMKLLRAVLWLLLSMLAGALLWQVIASDPGLVIVRFRGYDISTSVPVAGLFLLLAVIAVWLLVSLIRIPFRVCPRYRPCCARARLSDGLLRLHEEIVQ